MEEQTILSIGISLVCVVLVSVSWGILDWVWFKPKRLEKRLRNQGFNGNSYRLLYGDTNERARMTMESRLNPMPNLSNDFLPHSLAFFHHIITKYGRKCFIWNGPIPLVNIVEPYLIREIFMKINDFQKAKSNPLIKKVAPGLIFLEGHAWAQRRKLLTPAFHIDKLKFMIPAMWESLNEMIKEWEDLTSKRGSCEIEVWSSLQKLSADMISRAAFGSSYQEGKTIFDLITQQIKIVIPVFNSVYIPGWRFLPTKTNRRISEIDREIRNRLKDIIDKRKKSINTKEREKDDLLSTLLQDNFGHANKKQDIKKLNIEEVVNECKLFYLAGQDTTSSLLLWTLIMLGKHQIWQQSAREEIINAFGDGKPQFHELNSLKIVNMILQEVLRLYPPILELNREVTQDIKIGDVILPAGVLLNIPILLLQQDEKIWGKDAKEFNPERFSEGISKASKGNMSFFAFGWGPRICLGSNFAMIEAKLTLVFILQRFVFELSPSYRHAPLNVGTLRPQFGAPIIFRRR
ncbi:unnamed protein product [Amaranthus hypochondriacus]